MNPSKPSPSSIDAKVDWSEALTFETNSKQTSTQVFLAEGSGYYIWRIRPIGNFYEGEIANNLNWGPWSETPSLSSGTLGVNPSTFNVCNCGFQFEQPEKDKNWIFSKTHSDDGQTHEAMTYANGLQQVQQRQSASSLLIGT